MTNVQYGFTTVGDAPKPLRRRREAQRAQRRKYEL